MKNNFFKKQLAAAVSSFPERTEPFDAMAGYNPDQYHCILKWKEDHPSVIGLGGFSMVWRDSESETVDKITSAALNRGRRFEEVVRQEAKIQAFAAENGIAAKVQELIFLTLGSGVSYAKIVMDYVDGPTLYDVNTSEYHTRGNFNQLLKDFSKILTAFDDMKITYGDPKPENFMVICNGSEFIKVVAIDFGGAQRFGNALKGFPRTTGYYSPELEQKKGDNIAGPNQDNFGFGRTLVEFLVADNLSPKISEAMHARDDSEEIRNLFKKFYEDCEESGTVFTEENQVAAEAVLKKMGYSGLRIEAIMSLLKGLNSLNPKKRMRVSEFSSWVPHLTDPGEEIVPSFDNVMRTPECPISPRQLAMVLFGVGLTLWRLSN